ncbi:hypothetical protein E2C01_015310 [Portunus trituberculatus]|uniref:Uncharacterized protein n=1 Tax=Portunus trituberculatus TaxID=210409 RepID=A0A5B7DLA6_PORTR|nr:hypothetical protein [Portunus trituberculatus]
MGLPETKVTRSLIGRERRLLLLPSSPSPGVPGRKLKAVKIMSVNSLALMVRKGLSLSPVTWATTDNHQGLFSPSIAI